MTPSEGQPRATAAAAPVSPHADASADRNRIAAVLRGNARQIDALRQVRRASVERLRSDALSLRNLSCLRRWSLSTLDAGTHSLSASDFETFRGLTTSILRRPTVLREPAWATATICILDQVAEPSLTAAVERVFLRSDFGPSRRYETFARDGNSAIRGQNGTLLRHIAAIAHELGHCLREASVRLGGLALRVESEAAAQYLEEVALARSLEATTGHGPQHLESWRAYQRRIDALNHHFASLEWAELAGVSDTAPRLFAEQFRFLRPSYLDRPGSELVYAAASILRRTLFQTTGENPSLGTALRVISTPGSWLASGETPA